MSLRLARAAFRSAAFRNVQAPALRGSRRMASTSHATHSSSDKPWIIGSLLIFGPVFLFLISPSARKSHHTEHHNPVHKAEHDHAEKDAHATSAVAEQSILVEDDEGTAADVASSVALSEASDVPQDAQSAERHAELKSAAESEPSTDTSHSASEGAGGEEGTETHVDDARQDSEERAIPKGDKKN